MSSAIVCQRLVVVAGWGVRAEMLSKLYGYWPGEVVPVSLDDELLARCDSLSQVTDELLSLYPEPSVWMGWSLGSQVVMEAAARQTGSVSCAITLGGFPNFVADDSWPHGMPAADFRAFALGIRRDPQRYWLHFLLLMINGASNEKDERQSLRPWLEKGTLVSHEHLSKSLAWLEAGDQRALWRSLVTPALHVMGENDIVVRSRAQDLSLPASSGHAVVPGMAHWPGGCSASDCWAAIQSFFASQKGTVMGVMNSPVGALGGVSETLKSDIARGFGIASGTYESASRLQRFMGNTMLQKFQAVEREQLHSAALDLGCGTGWFTRKFAGLEGIGVLAGLDLSPGMLAQARESSPEGIGWIVGDAEHLPLLDDSVDLIFSNLMIQWCDDPRSVLRECQRILRPGGFLMVSTLLDGTLRELKAAWHAADPDHQHVNRFETDLALQAKVGAELPGAVIENRTIRLPYESPMALAGELRHLGAGFRGAGRRRVVTAPGRLRTMCRHYPKEPDGTIMASYEAAWIYWQKPQEALTGKQ